MDYKEVMSDKEEETSRFEVLFGNRLRQAREASGISRTELAEQVGISRPFMFQMEEGRVTTPLPLAVRVARILEIPTLDYLVEPDDKRAEELLRNKRRIRVTIEIPLRTEGNREERKRG